MTNKELNKVQNEVKKSNEEVVPALVALAKDKEVVIHELTVPSAPTKKLNANTMIKTIRIKTKSLK